MIVPECPCCPTGRLKLNFELVLKDEDNNVHSFDAWWVCLACGTAFAYASGPWKLQPEDLKRILAEAPGASVKVFG